MSAVARSERTGSRARRTLVLVGWAITAVAVWVAVRELDLGETLRALRAGDAVWLVPSLATLALAVALRAVRWWALFAGRRPPLAAVTRSLLVGYLFNNVFPLRAGEAARLVALNQRAGTSRTQIAATIGVERVFDVAALLFLLAAVLPWLPELSWLRAAAWLGVGLAVAVAVTVGVLAAYGERALRVVLWPLRWLPFFPVERWEHAPGNLALGLAALRRPGAALTGIALSLASWVVLAASSWLLMLGFDLGLSPVAGALVVVAVGLATIIPSPPAALGVFEAAAVVSLVAYGISAEHALSYALVLHAVNFFPFVVVGLLVLAGGPGRRAAAR